MIFMNKLGHVSKEMHRCKYCGKIVKPEQAFQHMKETGHNEFSVVMSKELDNSQHA